MREKVMSLLDDTDNIIILDPSSIDWSTFPWTNGYISHRITRFEIMKPYLISSAYYGTTAYEDVILLLNNIDDIFEVIPEQEIRVPQLQDLKTFIYQNKK